MKPLLAALLVLLPAAWTPTAAASTSDTACTSSARPVVLLHGTFSDSKSTWRELTDALKKDGRCAHALDYGGRGKRPVAQSAGEVSAFVDEVLRRTGAATVDLVGYSQGAVLARYYAKNLGGAAKAGSLIGIAPPNHGLPPGDMPDWLAKDCPACVDQVAGSPFMKALNEGGDLVGALRYTTIASEHDGLLGLATQALTGPADRVSNVVVQDRCPLDFTGHGQMTHAWTTVKWVVNALRNNGLADPAFTPC
ncbi:triacylglycerol lipase [Allokutzneria sp. NRRL B-24872]|uniref:esterase/lipase family protein n=1 Tax=Allokutzneria sp. NRRL B-24872 TaxID=1137961 RepID=UPI00143E0BAB|nr:alpha/beta fold hydrolase [Allokutzneria sp. NRRL B-24872]